MDQPKFALAGPVGRTDRQQLRPAQLDEPGFDRAIHARTSSRRAWVLRALALVTIAAVHAAAPLSAQDVKFRRGDANTDGFLDISDALSTFGWLFASSLTPLCLDAVDANDDSGIDVSDGIFSLNFLFASGAPIPTPGHETCGFDPSPDELNCIAYDTADCEQELADVELREIGHLLNRVAYGPSQADIDYVRSVGIAAYVDEQLQPHTIDETDNTALTSRIDRAFTTVVPMEESTLVSMGSVWRYRKGDSEPPAEWKDTNFDDTSWAVGAASIGYGDGDDGVVLTDMEGNYLSVYLRTNFSVDPASIETLVLRVNYDDAFVAYLNGSEITRRGISTTPPLHNRPADSSHEADGAIDIDVTTRKDMLVAGTNVLAVQVHNRSLTSSDVTIDVGLFNQAPTGAEPVEIVRDVTRLQGILHSRGIYSRRQLQAVLGEFWENHFTTDYDKVVEHLDEMQNSDATDAMGLTQAESEAAQIEFAEYQFFYDNALGNFGDLLLFSATTPSMLIYLDSVLNFKAEPNENYSREILELSAFGVDNRYVQRDVEELARVFTGWGICKVPRESVNEFPANATDSPSVCGPTFDDTRLVPLGPGWKYFKGESEPTPDVDGNPTLAWTEEGFEATGWIDGASGFGYSDGDDATALNDMQGSYTSVYVRRIFQLPELSELATLILSIDYDDGFIAYINGVEVARSSSMVDVGYPPAFNATARESREAEGIPDIFNLSRFNTILHAGDNVLAIQVHNSDIDSSDLSLLPEIIDRRTTSDGIENGDPNGVWTFRFDADQHDTAQKTVFANTPYQIDLPARTGPTGVQDGIEVIQAIVDHPSTAEFICIKLIQRFVSDRLTLANYKDGTAPPELIELLAAAIGAWNSTTPKGNIGAVVRTLIDAETRTNLFWQPTTYRAKVKTPIEFVNSSVRVMDADVLENTLTGIIDSMGMHFFTRDDPDGWSELGFDWIDTGSMGARIDFAQTLASSRNVNYRWSISPYLEARGISTSSEIVGYFNDLLYGGTLQPENLAILLEFLDTDDAYNVVSLQPSDVRAYELRVADFVALLLSLPQWNFQ